MNITVEQAFPARDAKQGPAFRDVVVKLARERSRRVTKLTFFALRSRGSRAGHAFRVLVDGRERTPLFTTRELAASFLRAHPSSTALVEPVLIGSVGERFALDPVAERTDVRVLSKT